MKNNKQFAAVIAAVMAAGMTFSAAAANTSFTIDMEKNTDSAWKNVAMANDDTVTTGALIRQNPDADAKVNGYLYRGGAVNVLWKGENWTEVESGGVHGYIRNDCLVYGDEAKGLAEHYGEYAAKASWNDVSVLTEGNANAKILEKAGDGDTYKVTCKDGHWFEVKTEDNKTAFLSEDDIDLVLLVDTAVDVNGERGSRGSSSSAERISEPAQAAVEEPAAQEPAYEEPAYQEPAYQEPAYQEPAYQEPAYQEPAYQEPAYQEPAYQEPASTEAAAADDGSAEYIYEEASTGDDTAAADYSDAASTDYTDDTASADYSEETASADNSDTYSDTAAADDYSDDTAAADDQEIWDDGSANLDEIYEDTTGETYYEESSDDAAYTEETASYDTYDEYTEDGSSYTDDYSDSSSDYSDSGSDGGSSTSSSDLDLLAAIIYHEAGNQPTEGKIAVGAVVLNRVYSSLFPNTISEVLYQSGQFTPAGELAGTIASGVPSDCYDAANQALAGNDPTGGCLYFNTSHGSGVHIGAHWFY